jgi:hypothetical protein
VLIIQYKRYRDDIDFKKVRYEFIIVLGLMRFRYNSDKKVVLNTVNFSIYTSAERPLFQ